MAIAGLSLDLVLGSDAEGSSVSMGAKLSPSRPIPSNSPVAGESTGAGSDSAQKKAKLVGLFQGRGFH